MKRVLLVVGVVMAAWLVAASAGAQQLPPTGGDYIYAFRNAPHIDILIDNPCLAQVRTASGPTLYDGNPWITFVCTSGEIVLRRYLNPNDHNSVVPIPVYTVADPNLWPLPPIAAPTPPAAPKTVACTVPGMVTSIHGGCVPSNHPDAPKNYGNR